ncbi:SRPBCC family protein [Parasphingorhabdus sp.]|uniref:SRPBCC family protein n=1 Tax=Parasphingorhabdus sp. TaxID=2709688 RepID=UPI003D2E05D1
MMLKTMKYLAGSLLLITALPAVAEVTNSAANGFTVKHQATIAADADAVWKAMIAPNRYWNPDHSWTGNADNFYLVPQAGGCFCELIRTTSEDNIRSSDGSVQHMRVIYAHNGKMLRMSGALGPLQGEAVVGTLTMALVPADDKTLVHFEYKVGGYMELPLEQISVGVDGVIGEQLSRLAALFVVPEDDAALEDESEADSTADEAED